MLTLTSAAAQSLAIAARPKAVIFDLDGCLWAPDMYMLWGGGGPFQQKETTPNNTLTDRNGTTVRLLADVAASWADCHRRMQAGQPVAVAAAASMPVCPAWIGLKAPDSTTFATLRGRFLSAVSTNF